MAKVEMDLNELKALELKIENLEKEKTDLISKQQMVVVLHKFFKGVLGSGNDSRVRITGIRIIETSRRNNLLYPSDPFEREMMGRSSYQNEMFTREMTIGEAISSNLMKINIVEDKERTSREYMNLDEVKAELTESIKFENQIRELFAAKNNLTYELQNAKSDSDMEIVNLILKKLHLQKIEEINESFDIATKTLIKERTDEVTTWETNFNELQQKYDDLKNNVKRETLEKQLEELSLTISNLQSRGFWARVFNK